MITVSRARPRGSLLALFAICALPVLVFYLLLWREMRSVPMFDDYHAILFFALRLRELPSLGSRLLFVVAAQHDEYKLVVEHALVAADLALTGHVHFGFLIAAGNLLTLGLGALLWQNSMPEQQLRARLLLFAPVLYLLFQLNYAENLDWAMCGLQTMPVLFFGMAALHFSVRPGWASTVLACFCAALSCLSSANGFLLLPIGLGLLAMRRRYFAVTCWIAAFAVAVAMYLFRYEPFRPEQITTAVPLTDKLLFFASFVGGAIENMHHYPVAHGSAFVGALILLCCAWAGAGGMRQGSPFFLALALWCLLTAAVVTQQRSHQGLDLSLTGRYKIYSDLLLICCYQFWNARAGQRLSKQPQSALLYGVLALSIVFCLSADLFGYRYLDHRQKRVALGLAQYVADPAHSSPEISLGGEPFAGGEPEFARAVLTQTLARSLYHLPLPLDKR